MKISIQYQKMSYDTKMFLSFVGAMSCVLAPILRYNKFTKWMMLGSIPLGIMTCHYKFKIEEELELWKRQR